VITFQRVHLIYHEDRVYALKDVNIEFNKGEICFIAGPTGCGKSSLLKLIYMDAMPTRGRVKMLGKDTCDFNEREIPYVRRKIGVVFQDFRLISTKTVFENVAYPLEVTGASRYEINRRVPQVLELVGLLEKTATLPGSLSKGQEQRVSIARAIVNDPMILLADEPTGNLDPDTSWDIVNLLMDIQTTRGTTVIVASHDMVTVERVNKRIVRIEQGMLASDSRETSSETAHRTAGEGA
jgi:cell division transport system ATP-binding protein